MSVGTSRQPISIWPSLAMKCSKWRDREFARRLRRAAGSTSRPHSRRPAAGRAPRAAAQSRSRASGIWIRQPAPSPTSGSAPDRAAVVEVDQDLEAAADRSHAISGP